MTLENKKPDMNPDRPISPVCATIFHLVADGDPANRSRLHRLVLDPKDVVACRWEFFRLAERDAWKAVELLLLKKTIRRRFREGDMAVWVEVTPFGEDIQSRLETFFEEYEELEFPTDPRNFTTCAFQELRAARLSGELYVERAGMPQSAAGSMEQLAAAVQGRFPHLAQVVRHPEVNVAALARSFLGCRLGANLEMQEELPLISPASAGIGLMDLAMLLQNWPAVVEELIGDFYADAEMARRLRFAAIMSRESGAAVTKEEARRAVEDDLGRASGGPRRRRE